MNPLAAPLAISLLGAESTGKTQLAQDLAAHLRSQGRQVQVVSEYLREWCEREGRTPRKGEQMAIAQEQARRVLAAPPCDVLIADTTPLMVAIYSDYVFADSALYAFALAHQRHYGLTLLTGLDLPWVPDGLQREGPQVQAPIDALLRRALDGAGLAYHVVYGSGAARLNQALCSLQTAARASLPENAPAMNQPPLSKPGQPRWYCERCSQPECEHRLFAGLLAQSAQTGGSAANTQPTDPAG
jgi:nicotinamide riboside kinase